MTTSMKLRASVVALMTVAGATGTMAAGAVEVKYSLWDANQLPAYRQCATDFEKANPGITIKILQTGWYDYWTTLNTNLVAGTAPDVITDHLTRYPEFVNNKQVVDLTPYIRRDKIDLSIYPKDLLEIWSRDGKQYGLPKDWDTIAMAVNMEHARKAGVTLAELQNMNWNPKDGGTFEKVVRKLTLDAKGNNALSPAFDKNNVVMYGYQNPASGRMMGQIDWSHFAVSNGFKYQDKPWSPKFYYDDPRLIETLAYLASLPGKGLSARYENARPLGADAMFVSGKVAMVPQGSWMMTAYRDSAKFNHAWVPLPVGPIGTRATMFNGLADSIWTGSKVKEDAWKWVKYLASPACQGVVANHGVVFPAIQGMSEKAIEVQKKKGVDSSAFLVMAKSKTFLTPIADNASEIDQIIATALEQVWIGSTDPAAVMKAANDKANELLKKRCGTKCP